MQTSKKKKEKYYSGDGEIHFPYTVEDHKSQEFFSVKTLLKFCEEQGIKKIKPTGCGLIYEQKENGWYLFYKGDSTGTQIYTSTYKCTNSTIESIAESINDNPNTFLSIVVVTKGHHYLLDDIKKGLDISHASFNSSLWINEIKSYEVVTYIKLKDKKNFSFFIGLLDEYVQGWQKTLTNCLVFEIDESDFAEFIKLAPFTRSISSVYEIK